MCVHRYWRARARRRDAMGAFPPQPPDTPLLCTTALKCHIFLSVHAAATPRVRIPLSRAGTSLASSSSASLVVVDVSPGGTLAPRRWVLRPARCSPWTRAALQHNEEKKHERHPRSALDPVPSGQIPARTTP